MTVRRTLAGAAAAALVLLAAVGCSGGSDCGAAIDAATGRADAVLEDMGAAVTAAEQAHAAGDDAAKKAAAAAATAARLRFAAEIGTYDLLAADGGPCSPSASAGTEAFEDLLRLTEWTVASVERMQELETRGEAIGLWPTDNP